MLALPGLLDRTGTLVLRAPNLGWEGVAPADFWHLDVDGVSIPLRSANDIDCAALTVLREDPTASFIYVTGEVGVGAAIAFNGELLTGRSGWAAELGHVCVAPDGDLCGCGARGCLETVAGTRALLRRSGYADLAALVAGAEAGEAAAVGTIDDAATALGIALSAALNLLDVENIRLGGHLGPLEPFLRDRLADELDVRVMWSHQTKIVTEVVERSPLRASMGAGLAALRHVLADPASWIGELLGD
ncbi:ROK family protein [Tessaracoccus sp. HDW20]|uniref:ROK family protein n=1 Tax=Tessaracoccus coleopterorum TaxID=2714950 RepID=UPI0018D37B5E|nr:ROK family protein [Tessaracoccus coleopterorum]